MPRALPRTNFNSSTLSRVLDGLGLVAGGTPGHASAERLGEWLNPTDAMRLYAALHAGGDSIRVPALSAQPAALAGACARLRATLAQAIEQSCIPTAGHARGRLPRPGPALPGEIGEIGADYEPYRRFQLAHQREMEAAIVPLRAKARAALAQAGPALAKLAAIDTAFGDILAGREAKLLAGVPALLERRFAQLRDAHRQTLAAAGLADDPTRWLAPGGWLARFCRELQTTLLAELDLRLQPVTGLIEAFNIGVSPP